MTNVNPAVGGAGYETADRVSNVLNVLSWLVVAVGVINAVLIVSAGFNVVEPWTTGGYVVDEEWKSVSLGFYGAFVALVAAGVGWALLQGARLVVRYVGARPMIAE